MRRRRLAPCLLILATAAGIAGSGASPVHASGSPGSWARAASLITGREGQTATLLRDGELLIAGGTDGRGTALATAEDYNPATNRWRSAGSMATTRVGHIATLLPSGKVLVTGGLDAMFPSNSLATTELCDLTTNVPRSPYGDSAPGRSGARSGRA